MLNSVIAFFMLFFLTLGLGAVALMLLGLDPVSAISGATTNLSNVGPGLGPVLGPVGNYASLNNQRKSINLMLVGRLESPRRLLRHRHGGLLAGVSVVAGGARHGMADGR